MQYQDSFIHILNKHAPVKTRRPRKIPLPCMKSELRGAIYLKHMIYTQYAKQRNTNTWETFRQQRNLVTKLKKKSMKIFFNATLEVPILVIFGPLLNLSFLKSVTLVNRKLSFVKTIKS